MRIDFYMGPEFLRTERKTNPFFDPIIKVCEESGIVWQVLVQRFFNASSITAINGLELK